MTTTDIPTLPAVIASLEATDHAWRFAALLAKARLTGGEYLAPHKERTHLHELTWLGVHARGEEEADLVRNWLTCAKNSIGAERRPGQDADPRLERHLLEQSAALAVIARPDLHCAAVIKASCLTILAGISVNGLAYDRARDLHATIQRETTEAPKCQPAT